MKYTKIINKNKLMDENEQKKNIIENDNNKMDKNEIVINNNQILNTDNLEILNTIFKKSKTDNSSFIPILLKNAETQIIKIFNDKPDIKDITILEEFILQKLKLISNIMSIKNISLEIFYIISNYLLSQNISIFTYITDLYISYITLNKNNSSKKNIITAIKPIFTFFISCGLLTRKDTDYIYQKISFFQIENKLSLKIFSEIIPLLEIIYGSEINFNNNKPNLERKYFYFYDKENSVIETNVNETSFIQIKNGFCIILWFFLKEINEDNGYKSSLVYMKNEKGDKLNVILNEKNSIEVLYKESIYLKEKDNKYFDIERNKWTQLRIYVNKNEINIYLYRNNTVKDNNNALTEESLKNTYSMPDSKMKSNISFYDCKIVEISFFKNYIGIVGTIAFLKEVDNKKKQTNDYINSLFNIKNKNLNSLLSDKISKNLCFIFSPYLYVNNKIISPKSNIIGRLPERDGNAINLNSIFSFHYYINNIFYLGGCNNFLPLFEILYKFTIKHKNKNKADQQLMYIFSRLFKILEIVFSRDKNCLLPLQQDINFFKSLQIFLERIHEKYYYNNEELLNCLLNIGKKYNELKDSKPDEIKEENGFFISIFFNPDIIIKFSLSLQKKYFESIKCFKVLPPFNKINKFLLLLSQKYQNNETEKEEYSEPLFNYIKLIFENIKVSDSDREKLFLIYQNKNNDIAKNLTLSDNIFIQVLKKVFILYFDINIKNPNLDEAKKNQRKQTVNYLLDSENYFIETLLKYLSTTNLHVKKVIINLLRVLTQIYGDILEQYFTKVSKLKKNERINKEEFYYFIKENISPNYNNEKILGGEDSTFNLDEKEKNNSQNKNEIIINEKEKIKEEFKIQKRYKSSGKTKKIYSETIKNISTILSENQNEKRKISINKDKDLSRDEQPKENVNNDIIIKKDENEIHKEAKDINIINNDKHIEYEKMLEIQNSKHDIALYLYNWLLSLVEANQKNKEEIKDKPIRNLIELIVKFISYTKELEVIVSFLILLTSQKETSEKKNRKKIYKEILWNLSQNQSFLQILIELLIHSYIYKTIYGNNQQKDEDHFIIICKNESEIPKLKLKNWKSIYEISLIILIDLIFFDDNQANRPGRNESNEKVYRSNILNQAFLVSLKLFIDFQEANDINKKNLLIKFVKQFLFQINQAYIKKHTKITLLYFIFFTFFMDYSFILKNSDEFLSKSYDGIKNDRTHCIPDFLIHGLSYENEGECQWAGSDILTKILNNIKELFFIKNIFENLELVYKEDNKQKEKEDNILVYDLKFVNSLINDIISQKKKEDTKELLNISVFFFSYKLCGFNNKFPIINIISLFNSLNLYLFYWETNTDSSQNKLLSLLKDIQNYIIFFIVVSYIIAPDNFSVGDRDYDDIQMLIYQNLFFNIQNLLNRLKDEKNRKIYMQVLYNIMLFLSVLYNIDQNGLQKKKSKGFLKKIFQSWNDIDMSRTGPIMLINFYLKNNDNIFNEKNFAIFNEGDKEKSMKILEDSISYDNILEMNNMKDNPSFDLYRIEIFEDVVFNRESEFENMNLLIDKENQFVINCKGYKDILLKVNNIKNNFYFDDVRHQQEEVSKIKQYRKIKKDLYSFNNSYSNLQAFYNIPSKQKSYFIKYKVTNFLSRDMSRKLIKPIIDVDYYMPNFRKYIYVQNSMYYHPNNEVYTVDLQIFKPEKKGFLYPDTTNNYFYRKEYHLEENICYIKTSNHIKGIIYHLNKIEKLSDNYLYFCITKQPNKEEKIKSYEDFDSLNDSCFNSIFRNNLNKKDKDSYIKINLGEIIFIFCRKYCFKDNSLEIFTSFHKSYYFKFRNSEKRNKFLEHILSILNKDISLNKKLFKPINSINENGKKIIIGYYKDIENNGEYASISNIKEMWKNCKISSFEYLLWINIYGNRSYRDISQYPVFPWIITDYMTETFEDIIYQKHLRNLTLPMGLMTLNDKGKERREGYITTYRFMSMSLLEDEIIDFKIKDEEIEDEDANQDQNDIVTNNISNPPNNTNNPNIENIPNTSNASNNSNTEDKLIDSSLPKIPQYSYDIDKLLYKNALMEYDRIPYLFGSHFSNAMYISHYLGRLFPYSNTMIEIQGSGFDCAERLFLCIEKTFSSATCEKCDVRELTPEFYSMPEMLLNINKLNFGQINITNYSGSISYYDEFFEQNGKKDKILIQDVLLPKWCKDNPFSFIIKKRQLIENNTIIDLNPWIDLIFGNTQRGKPAQKIGNLFFPCTYDGVINCRIKDEDILKHRNELEYKMRLFELGVNPLKVFDKKLSDKKKIINKQITEIKGNIDKNLNYIFNIGFDINYVINIHNNTLVLIGKEYQTKKIYIEEKVEMNNSYKTKELVNYNFIKEVFDNTIYYKLYIKYFAKNNLILLAGFYNGEAYLFSPDKNHNLKNAYRHSKNKMYDILLLNYFKKGYITSLEVSQDEKYIISGNNKGTLVVVELLNMNNITNVSNAEYSTRLIKTISSHSGCSINSISINTDLNLFGDCSYDNFIHIYTLPKCDKIISIYNKDPLFYPDFIFLSAQPLSSIILYSNKTTKFKSYSINGYDINIEKNDVNLLNESKYKNKNFENMISPIIFTNSHFNDFLIYVFRYQYILLRKTPLMDLVFKINFNENEFISKINISLMKEYIYAVDNNNKKVYIIQYDKCKAFINEEGNQSNNIDNLNNNFEKK